MNEMETIINICNLSKLGYKNIKILKDINLNIKHGELVGLLGPSGCGKSTLLKIIVGIETTNITGSIYIRNNYANNLSIYNRKICLLDNNSVLFNYMNVFDNINFGFRDDSSVKIEDRKKIIEYFLRILKIDGIAHLYPDILSHGQQQKVKFARSIINFPDIVLLDEALDGLDESNSELIYKLIIYMNKKYNTTFIISSHDTYEILEITNRIIIMNNGSIVVNDNKNKVLEKHNNFSWDYFNIGTVLKAKIISLQNKKILCELIQDKNIIDDQEFLIKENIETELSVQNFISIDLSKYDNIFGVPKINNVVLLYVDPRSNLYEINTNQEYENQEFKLIKIIDFIFYYQNIFMYKDCYIQINTTNKLNLDISYKIEINYSLISFI